MNIALEKTQEYVDGKARRSYGDAFVRGNNGKHGRRVAVMDAGCWILDARRHGADGWDTVMYISADA